LEGVLETAVQKGADLVLIQEPRGETEKQHKVIPGLPVH